MSQTYPYHGLAKHRNDDSRVDIAEPASYLDAQLTDFKLCLIERHEESTKVLWLCQVVVKALRDVGEDA